MAVVVNHEIAGGATSGGGGGGGGGGGDMLASNNLSDLTSKPSSRVNLGVAIGTNVQAWDADLDAIAGLVSAPDRLPYASGAQNWALTVLTAFIRTLLDDPDASTARGTLGAQITLISGTNIKTVNSQSILGSGDLVVSGSGDMVLASAQTNTGVKTFAAGTCLVNTATQGDNSTKAASTAYVDTLGATKVTALTPYSLTGANTLIQATHFNRHGSWTGAAPQSQAISASASTGDYLELTNDGSAAITFTGITPKAGFKASAEPGETFFAVYSNSAWVSLTPVRADMLPLTKISADYPIVLTDFGVLHDPTDASARQATIPANASIAFPLYKALTFINPNGAGTLTIAITSDTMRLAGAGTAGSRTLAANGVATAVKISATEWIITGTGLT